jgi:AcrR family transcriptional regulator
MPAPAKTSDAAIVEAARRLVDADGPDALSMLAVAEAVGVRAPSLYKRFPDRDALLDAVAALALDELRARLSGGLAGMARAYRAWARRHPGLYALLYTRRAEGPELVARRAETVAPVLEALAPHVAPEERLPAARLLTAYLHGHVSMELLGAFRLGGDVDAAFEYGLARLTAALGAPSGPRRGGRSARRRAGAPGRRPARASRRTASAGSRGSPARSPRANS